MAVEVVPHHSRQDLALRCLERALNAAATVALPSDTEEIRSSLEIWEKTWDKCEEFRAVVVRRASVAVQHVHPGTVDTGKSGHFCGCDHVCVVY